MLSDKKLARIEKMLGKEQIEELTARGIEGLEAGIAASAGAIKESEDELEANPKFQELKESLKACSMALREVKAYQNAKIQFSLHLLEEKGKV
jgi:hypothetical protein